MNEYFMPPVGWQERLMKLPTKNLWVWGGRQIGKSRTCINMQLADVIAGGRAAYSCPDPDTADNNWLDICNAFIELKDPRVRVNKVERGVVEIVSPVSGRTGQYRRYVARKKGNRGGTQRSRGQRVSSILHDEIQLASNSRAYYAAASALTITKRGREFICMTTPADPAQYLECTWIQNIFDQVGLLRYAGTDRADYIVSPKGWEDWTFVRQPTTPYILAPVLKAVAQVDGADDADRPLKWWEKQAQDILSGIANRLTADEYAREYDCMYALNTEGSVIDAWSDKQVDAAAEYDPEHPVYWCADQGSGSAPSVILFFQAIPTPDSFGRPFTQFRVFDELFTGDRKAGGEVMLASALKFSVDKSYEPVLTYTDEEEFARLRPYRTPDCVFPDIRAKDLVDGCDEIGLEHEESSWSVWAQIRTINNSLVDNRLKIHPRCSLVRNNMVSWMKRDDGEPADEYNDAAQALAYGMLGWMRRSGESADVVADARRILSEGEGEQAEMVELLSI